MRAALALCCLVIAIDVEPAFAQAENANLATLNCRIVSNLAILLGMPAPVSDVPITIDYGSASVNGTPATFTATEISWNLPDVARASLNRLSGAISLINKDNSVLASGYCSVARRQF